MSKKNLDLTCYTNTTKQNNKRYFKWNIANYCILWHCHLKLCVNVFLWGNYVAFSLCKSDHPYLCSLARNPQQCLGHQLLNVLLNQFPILHYSVFCNWRKDCLKWRTLGNYPIWKILQWVNYCYTVGAIYE